MRYREALARPSQGKGGAGQRGDAGQPLTIIKTEL